MGSDMVTLKINVFFVLPGFNALKKKLTRFFTWPDIILEAKDLLPSLVLSVLLGVLCPANAWIILHTSCVMTISWVSWPLIKEFLSLQFWSIKSKWQSLSCHVVQIAQPLWLMYFPKACFQVKQDHLFPDFLDLESNMRESWSLTWLECWHLNL